MNLLIVDDEIYAIQGILDSVDWKQLPFEKVLTANSYTQALNIFLNHQIDLLICDIEMPYGSGLDLVGWVKENHPKTECIFLTCHDEFDFAKQAIKLQCLDYLLKPIAPDKLQEVMMQGIENVNQHKKDEQYVKYGMQYLNQLNTIQEETGKMKPADIIKKVESYIQTHLSEPITVEEISSQVFISPDHLTRLFKKETSLTVIDFITQQRMFWAKELLIKNEVSIAMISAKVGYSNYSYFTKVFKKTYGETPRDFIKKRLSQ